MNTKKNTPRCASCAHPRRERRCMNPTGKPSEACPTLLKLELLVKAQAEYRREDLSEFARLASVQEAECYSGREKKPYVKDRVTGHNPLAAVHLSESYGSWIADPQS